MLIVPYQQDKCPLDKPLKLYKPFLKIVIAVDGPRCFLQMLGSLGLLIGTFGLAAVMVRNIVERRREIALMRAVGFTTTRVFRLVFLENGILLLWGMLLGAGSALLAMLPHLRSTGADLPWLPLLLTLLLIAAIGSLASLFAVRIVATISVRESLAAE